QTNEILAQTYYHYDEAGRLFQVDRDHFDAQGNVSLADGTLVPPITSVVPAPRGALNTTLTVYDPQGRVLRTIDDNAFQTIYAYDRADRLSTITDAVANVVTIQYDKDGNRIDIQESEHADVGTGQIFVTRIFYDELNRVMAR